MLLGLVDAGQAGDEVSHSMFFSCLTCNQCVPGPCSVFSSSHCDSIILLYCGVSGNQSSCPETPFSFHSRRI